MKFIYLLIVLLHLAACLSPTESTAFDSENVKSEVFDMLSDYHTDIRKYGMIAEFNYLDSSDDFFWVPPGYVEPLSYDSVRAILKGNALNYRSIEFKWEKLKIFPLSNDLASYSGVVGGKMLDTADLEYIVSIIESGTVIKRKGGWKLLNGQSAAIQ